MLALLKFVLADFFTFKFNPHGVEAPKGRLQCCLGKQIRLACDINVRAKGFPATLLRRADMRKLRREDTFPRVASRRNDAEQNLLVRTMELSNQYLNNTYQFSDKMVGTKEIDIIIKFKTCTGCNKPPFKGH